MSRPTILIVEDRDELALLAAFALRGAGMDVIIAANGREAILLLEDGVAPAAIILDLDMPVMNGRQFRVWQLSQPRFAQIPVVLFTAKPTVPDVPELRGLILCSKYNQADLAAAVRAALAAQGETV